MHSPGLCCLSSWPCHRPQYSRRSARPSQLQLCTAGWLRLHRYLRKRSLAVEAAAPQCRAARPSHAAANVSKVQHASATAHQRTSRAPPSPSCVPCAHAGVHCKHRRRAASQSELRRRHVRSPAVVATTSAGCSAPRRPLRITAASGWTKRRAPPTPDYSD